MNAPSRVRNYLYIVGLLGAVFPLWASSMPPTPEGLAGDYLRAIQIGDWSSAANLLHHHALQIFKNGWVKRLETEYRSGQHEMRDLLFGPNTSLDAAKALAPRQYFVNTLLVLRRDFNERQLLFDKAEVLGSVSKTADLVHVRVRLDVQDEGGADNVYEEIVIKREGSRWGIWLDQKVIPGVDRAILARANL